jgi:hypothetical protein
MQVHGDSQLFIFAHSKSRVMALDAYMGSVGPLHEGNSRCHDSSTFDDKPKVFASLQ